MDEGRLCDLHPIARITLGDVLDRYMEEVVPTKAVGAQRNERNRIRLLKKRLLARRLITVLQSSDLAKYRNERMGQVISANTVRVELALLSHLYTIAIREWSWPLVLVLKDVKQPSPPEGRERRLLDGEE